MDQDEFNKVEELTIVSDCRVKEEGKKTAEMKTKGTTVKVSGNDKIQLLSTGKAVRGSVKKSAKTEN